MRIMIRKLIAVPRNHSPAPRPLQLPQPFGLPRNLLLALQPSAHPGSACSATCTPPSPFCPYRAPLPIPVPPRFYPSCNPPSLFFSHYTPVTILPVLQPSAHPGPARPALVLPVLQTVHPRHRSSHTATLCPPATVLPASVLPACLCYNRSSFLRLPFDIPHMPVFFFYDVFNLL